MKILHVIPSIDPACGGPVEGLKQLCHIYRLGNHEADVASMDSPEFVETCDFPATVYALGPGKGIYGYSHRAVPWFKANLSRYDVTFIHCIWQYNSVAVYRAIIGTNIPYAVFTHGMLAPYFKERYPLKHLKKWVYWRLVLRKLLHDANAVLFTCEEEKILARKSFSHYRVHETVVPYGTFGPQCDSKIATAKFLSKWPALRGKRIAIFLGRIHPIKGTDILIQAFADTLAKDPDWHLVVMGPDQGGMRQKLDELARRLGMSDRITWTGMQQGEIKWGAYYASEVFVLPSHQENFGIVVAEALSCGLPVIISTKVNIWREVMSYWAGLVCEDTAEGTREALHRWSLLTPSEIAALRSRSKKCFDELFDYKVTSKRTLENVEQIARHKQSALAC